MNGATEKIRNGQARAHTECDINFRTRGRGNEAHIRFAEINRFCARVTAFQKAIFQEHVHSRMIFEYFHCCYVAASVRVIFHAESAMKYRNWADFVQCANLSRNTQLL